MHPATGYHFSPTRESAGRKLEHRGILHVKYIIATLQHLPVRPLLQYNFWFFSCPSLYPSNIRQDRLIHAMNAADISRAPPGYLEVAWIADTCKLLMGLGWTTNYAGMIYKSLKDRTYGMALMPLCCNFAWELTYAVIYPFGSRQDKFTHYFGLMLNCGVMYTAVKNAEREWTHAPLVRRNLPFIFIICIAAWTTAHLALALQIGPSHAQAFSAYGCQLLLSVGALCQLLSRGSSRGASYFLW